MAQFEALEEEILQGRMIPLLADFNGVYQALATPDMSAFLIGGLGTNVSIGFFDSELRDYTTNKLSVLGVLNLGTQGNIGLADFIVSPFFLYKYSAGGYIVEYWGDTDTAPEGSSGTIEGTSTATFGLDVLFEPLNISLSSLVQRQSSINVFTLSLQKVIYIEKPD